MSLSIRLRRLLTDPRLVAVDYDTDTLIEVHHRILSEKPLMREVFGDFYRLCRDLDARYLTGGGVRVELGAGVSIFKRFYPDVLCTDVKPAPNAELLLDAQAMPFASGSVHAFYGLNCFHHFPDPEVFFAELERTLRPGGGCILIEPYHGPLARWFYRRLFDTETFDLEMPGWTNAAAGVMNAANQALSYIVFERDAERFHERHPNLLVVRKEPLRNYVRYLASGGLNFRQLVPTFTARLLRLVEALLSPAARLLALHQVIVLRKTSA